MAALTAATDTAFAALTWADLEEALAHHPRIGERPEGADRASAWSRAEQSGVGRSGADRSGAGRSGAGDSADRTDTEETAQGLRAGNLAYERRFGHVFLICATGLSAEQMLGALRSRLGNDVATEREIVRAELAKIAHLRVARLLEHP
jgi:2-oxo-4-hydroxy-4-carboxy-5-ureidoimidazoline decarboxylase